MGSAPVVTLTPPGFLPFLPLCSSVCDSSCGSSFFSTSFPASGCLGASLLPSAPFPWPVSLALALGSYLGIRGFHGCFRVLPLLCYTLSPVSALLCCPLHRLSLCFAGLLCGFIWLCPFFHGLRFGPGGSAPQPGPSSVFPPLSGASATPSVLLSQCLVMVLLSLCSWLLVQSLPVLRLRFLRLLFLTFDCLHSSWCLAYIDRYLVALLPLAAGFSQAPLPPCSLFVEFLLLLLLLVVMSLSWVERVRSTLGGSRSQCFFVG